MDIIEVRAVAGPVTLDTKTVNRSAGASIGVACGYAIRYGEASHAMRGSLEIIEPGAATRSLNSDRDVTALFEHERVMLLGRRSSGTLRLQEDNDGLYYEIDLPDTTVGRDLAALLQRGDITGSSFGFLEPKQRWAENEHGYPVRHVTELTLDHISPVATPAYPTTSADVRI